MNRLRVIVVGLGVQGHKRRRHAGSDFVATVDPMNAEADFRRLDAVPTDAYDAAIVCTPDAPKVDLLRQLIAAGKHALVEKPLWAAATDDISRLEAEAQHAGVLLKTAYNHRFEPHFVAMRELIASGALGRVYSCRMFYGNGTARLVRESAWRDQGAGVLPDLGSHLLDTCAFWFGRPQAPFRVIAVNRFENAAPDHVVVGSEGVQPRIELEMTLCMWRNSFSCDILAENGTAHIDSLCKWGPSTFTHRTRILPSGRPPEEQSVRVQDDPTWAAEYAAFRAAVSAGRQTDLSNDLWLQETLGALSAECKAVVDGQVTARADCGQP